MIQSDIHTYRCRIKDKIKAPKCMDHNSVFVVRVRDRSICISHVAKIRDTFGHRGMYRKTPAKD